MLLFQVRGGCITSEMVRCHSFLQTLIYGPEPADILIDGQDPFWQKPKVNIASNSPNILKYSSSINTIQDGVTWGGIPGTPKVGGTFSHHFNSIPVEVQPF